MDQIPDNLIFSYSSMLKVPEKVWNSIDTHAPNWNIHAFDSTQSQRFLETHFGKEHVETFCEMSGENRSDYFKYFALYILGGVYVDVNTILDSNLNLVFEDRTKNYINSTRTLVASRPKNPILKDFIDQRYNFSKNHEWVVLDKFNSSYSDFPW